jgi:hypothetical protein
MDARTAYETFLRKRVSGTHWSSVNRTLTDSGMEINPDTVVFFAKLRKEIPRASVGILQVFECYQKAEKLLAVTPFPPEDYLFSGGLKSDRKYFSFGED